MEKLVFILISLGCVFSYKQPQTSVFEHPTKLPETFPECVILIVKNYGLKTLQSESFVNLRSLKKLEVTRNELKALNGSEFVHLEKLQILNLKLNGITQIPSQEFRNLMMLKEIYLDENRITSVDKALFTYNSDITIISLRANDITKMHYKTFFGLPSLKIIDLSLNYLTALQGKLFMSIPSLEMLDLSRNNLKFIDPEINVWLQNLTDVDFENNPCVHGWISSSDIKKLSANIVENCTVTDKVWVEWLKEEVEELEEELKSSKLVSFYGCNDTTNTELAITTPQEVPTETSTDSSLNSTDCEDIKARVESLESEKKNLETENRNLTSLIEKYNFSNHSASISSSEDRQNCAVEREKFNLELNEMEERVTKCETDKRNKTDEQKDIEYP